MNIILLEKVQNLGSMGQQVKVRGGFGRNFLIPQGKAVPATAANIAYYNEKKAELEATAGEKLTAAEARAAALAELSVEIGGKAGDEGKLFGSIGNRDIAEAVTTAGVELVKSEVNLPTGPIRNLGEYEVSVHLHADVNATVKVVVIAAE